MKKVDKKRRRDILRKRLLKVMKLYFVHEDAGKKDKHERVVMRLRAAIKKVGP
jgi:hypothetical protein